MEAATARLQDNCVMEDDRSEMNVAMLSGMIVDLRTTAIDNDVRNDAMPLVHRVMHSSLCTSRARPVQRGILICWIQY